MSDPVTNVEIEDVLTSIRRLVSENGPVAEAVPVVSAPEPQPVSRESADASPTAPTQDKLVLTPALRVVGGDGEPSEDAAPSNDADESLAATLSFLQSARAKDKPSEDQASHDAAPVVAEPHDEISDTDSGEKAESLAADIFVSEDLAVADDTTDADTTDADAAAFADAPLTDEDPGQDAIQPHAEDDATDIQEPASDLAGFDAGEGIALSDAQSLDSRIVQWEHVSETDVLAFEPDAPGDSDYAGTEIESLSWIEALTKAQAENPTEALEAEQITETHHVLGDLAEESHETLHDDAAEITEHLVAESFAEQVRSDPHERVLAGMVDQIEAEAQEIVGQAVEQAIVPELGEAESDESVLLDEVMLRDLINDIVHQELQGALGERITRNVRKLVRREIHRALAAHDVK